MKLVIAMMATTALGSPGCTPGGCVWTEASDASLTPSAECLEVTVLSAEHGCVNPTLSGTNDCAEALSIGAEWSLDGVGQDVLPGEDFVLDVPLEKAEEDSGNGYAFIVPVTIGSDAATISFSIE